MAGLKISDVKRQLGQALNASMIPDHMVGYTNGGKSLRILRAGQDPLIIDLHAGMSRWELDRAILRIQGVASDRKQPA